MSSSVIQDLLGGEKRFGSFASVLIILATARTTGKLGILVDDFPRPITVTECIYHYNINYCRFKAGFSS